MQVFGMFYRKKESEMATDKQPNKIKIRIEAPQSSSENM